MNMEKYLRAVRRRLNMPKDWKDRVMTDFRSAIEARSEAGQEDASIIAELGTPKQAAKELNGQMQEYTTKRVPGDGCVWLLPSSPGFVWPIRALWGC